MEEKSQICTHCNKLKSIDNFRYDIKKHAYRKTCLECVIKNKKSKSSKNEYDIRKLTKLNDPR